jgi:hypothetical protein
MGCGVPYGLAVYITNPQGRRPHPSNNFADGDFKA